MRTIETLQLSTIEKLDGRLEAMFQFHLERARADCMNRPADNTARKVILEFDITPVMDPETRECDATNVVMTGKSKVPDHKSATYKLGVDAKKKGLLFDIDSPEDIDQPSLFQSGNDQAV